MDGTTEAERRYPERPVNLPEGQAVVVPVPERKAFIAGAAWQAAQPADTIASLCRELDEARAEVERLTRERDEARLVNYKVLEPFARHADAVSLSGALGHIERAHLIAARDLVYQLLRET